MLKLVYGLKSPLVAIENAAISFPETVDNGTLSRGCVEACSLHF